MDGPAIIGREAWGAQPPAGQLYRMRSYDGFVVHHSAGAGPHDATVAAATVRQVQTDHLKRPGWVDIGYNFLIDAAGRIYQGRPRLDDDLARGAHAPGVNSTHVGICLLGCFHPPEAGCDDVPAAAQVDALVALCRHLMVRQCMRSPQLGGHRDHRATACPGDVLYALLDEVRDRIAGDYTVTLERPAAPA